MSKKQLKNKLIIYLTLITLLIANNLTAQIIYTPPNHEKTNVPEIDSLIATKERLKDVFYTTKSHEDPINIDLILWYDYQIDCWQRGNKHRVCMFSRGDGKVLSGDCGIDGRLHKYYIGDTIVHVPRKISYPGFMKWKSEIVLKQKK